MAQRHPSSRRAPGEKHEEDDVFVARTLQFTEWARRNTTLLVAVVVVLALVIWGAVYYTGFQEEQTARATVQLEAIRQTAAGGDPQAARDQLGTFLQSYEGTPVVDEARILLGRLHLQGGSAQQAVNVLEPAFGDVEAGPLAVEGALLLGAAYEEAGRWEAAEQTYLDVSETAEMGFQVRQALADAARIRARTGRHAGAAELYRRILDEMPEGDPQRGFYQLRLGEMEAAAEG